MAFPTPFANKYLLLDRINIGGMAEVFKAKTFGIEGFEKIIAIKRILPAMLGDNDFITMFIDEARIASNLNHSNIAQIYELGKFEDSYFIVMEYISGKDLRQILDDYKSRNQTMTVPMAAFIICQVCAGLDFAHKKKDTSGVSLNIVHRDVSPQNVLISFDGMVKVCDFGIAKAASRSSMTQAGVLKGKFAYMSPEQVRGNDIDHRSDLFSLGNILYEMITGERLFLGESDFSTLQNVRDAKYELPTVHNKNISKEFENILVKTLQKKPQKRYQWASELYDDLQQFLILDKTIFSQKMLAQFMQEFYAAEMKREQDLLREYMNTRPPSSSSSPLSNESQTSSIPSLEQKNALNLHSQVYEFDNKKNKSVTSSQIIEKSGQRKSQIVNAKELETLEQSLEDLETITEEGISTEDEDKTTIGEFQISNRTYQSTISEIGALSTKAVEDDETSVNEHDKHDIEDDHTTNAEYSSIDEDDSTFTSTHVAIEEDRTAMRPPTRVQKAETPRPYAIEKRKDIPTPPPLMAKKVETLPPLEMPILEPQKVEMPVAQMLKPQNKPSSPKINTQEYKLQNTPALPLFSGADQAGDGIGKNAQTMSFKHTTAEGKPMVHRAPKKDKPYDSKIMKIRQKERSQKKAFMLFSLAIGIAIITLVLAIFFGKPTAKRKKVQLIEKIQPPATQLEKTDNSDKPTLSWEKENK